MEFEKTKQKKTKRQQDQNTFKSVSKKVLNGGRKKSITEKEHKL